MPRAVPPRLYALMAAKAPYGVIFRRGPSRVSCAIGWDRRTDDFKIGQWLKARIDVGNADISPNGKHIIYFASDYGREMRTWTAVSRAPFLKAVVLYAKGNSWNGGGLFTSDTHYWLNDSEKFKPHQLIHKIDKGLIRDPICPWRLEGPVDGINGEARRMLRDGWRWIDAERIARFHIVRTFTRPINTQWVLQKAAHSHVQKKPVPGRGTQYDVYSLKCKRTGEFEDHPAWDWADVDRRRLVWMAGGKLLTGQLKTDGLSSIRVLHDFNGMTFEPIAAPY